MAPAPAVQHSNLTRETSQKLFSSLAAALGLLLLGGLGSYRYCDDIGFDIVHVIVRDSSRHLNCVLAGFPHVV